ncbi:unnamed protein product, partial [marine sediment metagenome]
MQDPALTLLAVFMKDWLLKEDFAVGAIRFSTGWFDD